MIYIIICLIFFGIILIVGPLLANLVASRVKKENAESYYIKIREYRIKYGLTMAELGKAIGLSSGSISDLENGNTKNPGIFTILKFANFFEIPLDDLIDKE